VRKPGLHASRMIARRASAMQSTGGQSPKYCGVVTKKVSDALQRLLCNTIAWPVQGIGKRRGQRQRKAFVAMEAVQYVIPTTALLAFPTVGPAVNNIGAANIRTWAALPQMAPPRLIAKLVLTIGKRGGMRRKRHFVVAPGRLSACPTIAIRDGATLGRAGLWRRQLGAVAMRRRVARPQR